MALNIFKKKFLNKLKINKKSREPPVTNLNKADITSENDSKSPKYEKNVNRHGKGSSKCKLRTRQSSGSSKKSRNSMNSGYGSDSSSLTNVSQEDEENTGSNITPHSDISVTSGYFSQTKIYVNQDRHVVKIEKNSFDDLQDSPDFTIANNNHSLEHQNTSRSAMHVSFNNLKLDSNPRKCSIGEWLDNKMRKCQSLDSMPIFLNGIGGVDIEPQSMENINGIISKNPNSHYLDQYEIEIKIQRSISDEILRFELPRDTTENIQRLANTPHLSDSNQIPILSASYKENDTNENTTCIESGVIDKYGLISREAKSMSKSENYLPTEIRDEKTTEIKESTVEVPATNLGIYAAIDFNNTEEKLQETYNQFIERMQSETAPDIVQSCYLVSGYSKICIEVSNGYVEEASCYFQGILAELVENDVLDIFEEGIYHLVSPPDLTSDPEDETTCKIVKEPGKQLECIQAGSTVMVGGDTATVTMLARDINNSDKPYAITVSHVFSRKPEYVIGIKDSFSFIRSQEESIHIGSSYYGVISPLSVTYPNLDQYNTTNSPTIARMPHFWLQQDCPEVDIAAIPLDEKLINSLLIEKQVKRGFTFEIFTENNEVPSRKAVEIFGSRSGTRKGSIYPFKQKYKFVKGKMIKKQDYIAIISESLAEDCLFCRAGDSGSLVIDDITSHEAEVYQAYGILFQVNYHFKDKSLPGFPERRLALFVRLDNCFNELKQKWDIDLQPYTQNQEHLCATIAVATLPRTAIVSQPEETPGIESPLNLSAEVKTADSQLKYDSSPKIRIKTQIKSRIRSLFRLQDYSKILKTRSTRRIYSETRNHTTEKRVDYATINNCRRMIKYRNNNRKHDHKMSVISGYGSEKNPSIISSCVSFEKFVTGEKYETSDYNTDYYSDGSVDSFWKQSDGQNTYTSTVPKKITASSIDLVEYKFREYLPLRNALSLDCISTYLKGIHDDLYEPKSAEWVMEDWKH